VSTVRILLTGIGAEGRHGASPGERDARQPFVLDLDLFVDVAGDALETTADYRDLVRSARSVVEERSFALLESLAEAVAEAVASNDRVTSVVATVRKPGAAGRLGVADVAAQAVRAEAEE
jgi:7,8-dihydroneopterin aldolase/epimerase/oxygenase